MLHSSNTNCLFLNLRLIKQVSSVRIKLRSKRTMKLSRKRSTVSTTSSSRTPMTSFPTLSRLIITKPRFWNRSPLIKPSSRMSKLSPWSFKTIKMLSNKSNKTYSIRCKAPLPTAKPMPLASSPWKLSKSKSLTNTKRNSRPTELQPRWSTPSKTSRINSSLNLRP